MLPYQTFDVIWGLVFVALIVILQVLVLFHHIPFNISPAQQISIRALLCLCHCKCVLNYLWCGNTCNAFIKFCGVLWYPGNADRRRSSTWMVPKVSLVPLTGFATPWAKGWLAQGIYSFIIFADKSNKVECKEKGFFILLLSIVVSSGNLGF